MVTSKSAPSSKSQTYLCLKQIPAYLHFYLVVHKTTTVTLPHHHQLELESMITATASAVHPSEPIIMVLEKKLPAKFPTAAELSWNNKITICSNTCASSSAGRPIKRNWCTVGVYGYLSHCQVNVATLGNQSVLQQIPAYLHLRCKSRRRR